MTQLEQELTALFQDAASRLEVRPAPSRSARGAFVSRAVAAGLVAALVGAVALVAARLGSDSANHGGAVTPASTQTLIDAVARTLAQPIRVVSTFDSGHGEAQTSVTEMDADQHKLVSYDSNNQPQMLITGTHIFQGISADERQMFRLPASAQWVQVPRSEKAASTMMESVAGVINTQQLADVIASGRVTVAEVAKDTYRLTGNQPAPQGFTGADVETLHISADGLLDEATVNSDVPTGNGGPTVHLTITAHVTPLGHPLTVTTPDPSTVISQKVFQAAQGTQQCSVGPSPAASQDSNDGLHTSGVQCFSTTLSGTATGVPVRPSH